MNSHNSLLRNGYRPLDNNAHASDEYRTGNCNAVTFVGCWRCWQTFDFSYFTRVPFSSRDATAVYRCEPILLLLSWPLIAALNNRVLACAAVDWTLINICPGRQWQSQSASQLLLFLLLFGPLLPRPKAALRFCRDVLRLSRWQPLLRPSCCLWSRSVVVVVSIWTSFLLV